MVPKELEEPANAMFDRQCLLITFYDPVGWGARFPSFTVTAVCSSIVLISNGSALPPPPDEPADFESATAALDTAGLAAAEDIAEDTAGIIELGGIEDIAADIMKLLEDDATAAAEGVATADDIAAAEAFALVMTDGMALDITDDIAAEDTAAAEAPTDMEEIWVTIVDIGGRVMVEYVPSWKGAA